MIDPRARVHTHRYATEKTRIEQPTTRHGSLFQGDSDQKIIGIGGSTRPDESHCHNSGFADSGSTLTGVAVGIVRDDNACA